MTFPKISIITPSFNQGEYIEETILSVINQDYPNIEYIIIDGGSTDKTVEIIRKYADKISFWVSEPDTGQPEAINKGLAKASGEIIAFINSDDYYEPGAFRFVAEKYTAGCQWIIGSVKNFRVDSKENYLVKQLVDDSLINWLTRHNQNHQPGNFWSRQIYEKVGLMDETLHYSFDWDYWLKFIVCGFKPHAFNEKVLAQFRLHNESKTVKFWSKFNREYAFLINKYKASLEPAEIKKAEKEITRIITTENIKLGNIESINGRYGEAFQHFKTAGSTSPLLLLKPGFIYQLVKALVYMPIRRKFIHTK